MPHGNWHFAGACFFTLTLVFAATSSAQQIHAVAHAAEVVTSSSCATGQCGMGQCGNSCDGCRFGRCANKRNYWYLPYTEKSQPDLFYNFYVPNSCGSPAAAYPAPYPTPNLVGHTYVTYQPLMPHEWLYKHHRTYPQYYNGGRGLNRTTVKWQGTPVLTTVKGLRDIIRLPR